MKAVWIFYLTLLGIVSFVFINTAFGVEVSIGPEEIILKTEAARKPADFPHRQHQEAFTCTRCHHAKDEIMVIDKCESCHNQDISNPEVNSFKKAAHKLCKECHKQVNDQGKEAPIKCSGCHIKKS
jgi:predicted CXXCH cytochrome family protein